MKNQEADIKSQGDTKSSAKSRKKRRVRRWIYWVSGVFLIVFVIIPLLANFFADRIFGETAREIIRLETDGRYDFEYDKISFNIFSRDLSVASLQLLPDTNKVDSISGKFELPKKYFNLQVDELHIKLDGLWSVLLKRELTVTDIYLGKPSMRFVSPMAAADTTARSGDNFDHRDLHSYIKDYLSLLKIEQLTIDSGLFVLHSVAAAGDKVIKLDHISISISNFHLDSLAHQQQDRFFFSDSIGVSLNGGHFDLKDKNHEIAFGAINASSTGQSVELLDVLIRKGSTELGASEVSYEIDVPRLAFNGLDFVGVLDGKLLGGQLLISRPAIKLNLPPKHHKGKLPENFETEIFNTIASVFYPVDVARISIEHADCAVDNLLPDAMGGFHFPDLSLDLFKIRIDSSLISSPDPFYFISDVRLSLLNQELVLTKLEQKIAFDEMNFDTRNSTFIISQLNVASLNEAKLRFEATVDLPQLKIVGKDFKRDFVDRTLNLELVELLRPAVNLDLDPLIPEGDKNTMGDNINALSGGILKSITVDQFRLVDAGIVFGKGSGIFDKQLIADKLNIEVYDFVLPKDSLQIEDKIFYSSAIDIDVENLEFKLPDSVHQLNMDRFKLDTKKGTLSLGGVHIDTLKTIAGSVFNQLARMKIDVDHFEAMAVDFVGINKQEYIDVGEISIRNPKIFVSNTKDKDANSNGKIPEFLKNYFVGSLSIEGFDLVIEEAMQSRTSIKFTQGDILATDIKPASYEHFEELITDSLELSFDSVFYQPTRGTQVIAADHLHVSKKDSLLHIKNFELYPGNFSVDHFNKGWALHIPDIEVSGFAIHRAIYNKELLVQKVFADHTLFRLVTGKSSGAASTTPRLDLAAIKGQLLKTFNIWDVKTIEFDNSSLNAFSGTTYNTEIIDIEDFTIRVDDMYIDSTVNMTRDNVLFASDIQFRLNKPITFKGKRDQLVELKGFSLTTKDECLIAKEFTMTENQSSLNPHVIDESKAVFGFDEVDVMGIDFFDLFENRKLGIDSIMVEVPVFLLKREYTANQEKVKSRSKINFYDLISDHLYEARIDDFNVNDASFKIVNLRDGEKSTFLVNRVDVSVRNIFIDSANDVFNNKFLYSDDLDIAVEDYIYNTRNGLYSLGASNISFSSEDALLLIDSGFVTPLLEPAAFAKKVGVQTDRLDFTFNSARLENFRLYDLFFNNYFRADYFHLTGLEGEDYRDKSYDRPKNHFPNLPVTGLKNLAMGVRLDSVYISNSRFTYREFVKPATQPGRIWFDDISVKARNITNDEKLIAKRPTMGFVVKTKLMSEGAIDMTIQFDLQSEDKFSVDAVLNPMDLTKMNALLEHIAFVKIKKGQNDLLKFHFTADNDVARGDMNFEYNNLAIRLIDKKTLQAKGFSGGVVSFVANTFVVRSKNPAWGIFNKEGTIYFQRDKTKSFFNYLAKSALSGVSSTIRGGNEERKENRIKKKAAKKNGN